MEKIKRLFCRHHYYLQGRIDPRLGDYEMWEQSFWIHKCSKCGKIYATYNAQKVFVKDKAKEA